MIIFFIYVISSGWILLYINISLHNAHYLTFLNNGNFLLLWHKKKRVWILTLHKFIDLVIYVIFFFFTGTSEKVLIEKYITKIVFAIVCAGREIRWLTEINSWLDRFLYHHILLLCCVCWISLLYQC